MKILMVISQFHPMIGGAEKQAQLLSQKLIEKGHEVHVVTGWWNLKTPHKEIINGIKIYRNFTLWGMFGIKGIRSLGGFLYMVSLASFLLRKRNYDIVHVHQALYPAFVSVLIGKQVLGKVVIVKTASSGITSDLNQLMMYPLGRFQAKYLLREMDCLVALSQISGRDFAEAGFPISRITHIPNGVEIPTEQKCQAQKVKKVITTTRLSREKGVDVLLDAFANLVSEERNVRLTILGDGPLEPEMKKRAHSLGIRGDVQFTGFVDSVVTYFRDADLFVLPSRAEGMSNALLEAMSFGLPCIATSVGGNIELIGGNGHKNIGQGHFIKTKNGLLVNPDDVKGLFEAILYLVRHKEERVELGRRSRAFIKENYSIDLIADRYISLYQSMLKKRS